MPSAVIEAAALHHEPPSGEQQQLTPLAAVHIANVLEHQLRPNEADMMVAPIISTPFLNELGLLERLPVWRAAFANQKPASPQSKTGSAGAERAGSASLSDAPVSRTANQLPAAAVQTRTSTYREPTSEEGTALPTHSPRMWVYAGVATAVLALLVIWFRIKSEPDETEPVYARTPAAARAPKVASPRSSPEAPSVETPQIVPTASVSQEPSTPTAPAAQPLGPEAGAVSVPNSTVSRSAASLPAPSSTTPNAPTISTKPTPAAPSTASSPNVPPATTSPERKKLPEFRITGIIYTSQPSAIVNGESVGVGDHINGATVIAIGRTTVTLQINGQLKAFELR